MDDVDVVLPGEVPVTGPEAESSPESAFRKYQRLVPWAVGLSLATLILISVWFQARRGGDVLAELSRVDPRALAAALGLHLLMQVAWAGRIYVLGRGLGAPVRLPRALALVTSGLFAAAVTPGRVGGEPWRIAMLVRGGASGAAASRTIVADRAVDMLFFLGLGAVAVALLPSYFGQDVGNVRILGLVALLGLFGIAVAIGFILVRPAPMARLLGKAARLGDRMLRRARKDRTPAIAAFFHEITGGIAELLRRRPSALLAGALLSFGLWSCELSILWVVLKGFGYAPPYGPTFLAGVLIIMVGSVPALPGGTGVAEVAALALLTPLAPGLTPAFLVAWRGMTYYVDLLAGGLMAGWVARRPAVPAAAPTPT
ncbi:MAG TPA: lysylphosphatidylglycerol synthase transmembrane domain-containing protein [Candidatus Thermoplasmatota archaeon]|nr:lysylphosphatidylglycerol synthase transmembrane domain-containing protein [Candidatus Thermoplasmatota archaeon]